MYQYTTSTAVRSGLQKAAIHYVQVSMRSFVRFLVDSPLQSQLPADYSAEAAAADGSAPYGTYHMQYWLGPQLVAVSVVDVLPRCISSVYCFWSKR